MFDWTIPLKLDLKELVMEMRLKLILKDPQRAQAA